jgi:hypothetical protein
MAESTTAPVLQIEQTIYMGKKRQLGVIMTQFLCSINGP